MNFLEGKEKDIFSIVVEFLCASVNLLKKSVQGLKFGIE